MGGRIRELRVEKGWSRRELAARLGISPSRLNKYESGVHVAPLRALLRLAELLDVPLQDVVPAEGGEGTPPGGTDLPALARQAQQLPRREREALAVVVEALLRSLRRPAVAGGESSNRRAPGESHAPDGRFQGLQP